MSESTIRKKFRVNTVLTNATTATIEVTRQDTSAVVVAAGTPMTPQATGVYSHTFDDPADGLVYDYTATFTFGTPTETHTSLGIKVGGVDTNQNLYDLIPLVVPELSGQPEDPVMKQALRRTAVDFCLRTGIWRIDLDPIPTVAFQGTYTLSTSFDAVIHRISKVRMDTRNMVLGTDDNDYRPKLGHTSAAANEPITGASFATFWELIGTEGVGDTWAADTIYHNAKELGLEWGFTRVGRNGLDIVIDPVPSVSNWNIDIEVTLVPKETCDEFSTFLMDRWGLQIAGGTIGRLSAQAGRPWHNPALAQEYLNRSNGYYEKGIIDAKLEVQTQRGTGTRGIALPRIT